MRAISLSAAASGLLFATAPLWAAAPANDNFANRLLLSGPSLNTSGSNVDATKEFNEPNHYGNLGGRSVWWKWTAPTNAVVTIDTVGSSFDTLLAVYLGDTVSNLALVASDNDGAGGTKSRVVFAGVAGVTYQIAVDGYGGAAGTIQLNLVASPPLPPPINDGFANRLPITGALSHLYAHNVGATIEPNEPHSGNAAGRTVWWTWNASASGTVLLDAAGSSFLTSVSVYTGTLVTNLSRITNGNGNDSSGTKLTFPVVPAGSYQIAVDGFFDNGGAIMLNLQFVPLPLNDDFADAVTVTGLSNVLTGHNFGATREPNEPVHALSGAGKTVWWKWTAPADRVMTISSYNSPYSPVFAVYSGDAISQLERVGSSSFPCLAGRTYYIAADGSSYSDSGFISLRLQPNPPPGNDFFANRVPLAGTNDSAYSDNINATRETGEPEHPGATAGSSVWWSWTSPLNLAASITIASDEFDPTLAVYTGTSVSNLALVASGSEVSFASLAATTYQIAVDGRGPESGRFSLQLNAAPHPQNDAFASRIPLSGLSNVVAGSNRTATREPGEPDHAGHSSGKSVWWSWTAPTNWTVSVHTVGSSFDAALGIYQGNSVSTLTPVAGGFGNAVDQVTFAAVTGATYLIAVDAGGPTGGDIVLTLQAFSPPINDSFAGRIPILGNTATVVGSNVYATRQSGEPAHAGESGGRSLWWRWTAPANGAVILDTRGSSFDTLLAVYTGNLLSSLVPVASDDQSGGSNTSTLTFSATAGTIYQIAVDGYAGDFGSVVMNLRFGLPAANDAFAGRFLISGIPTVVTGSNAHATRELFEPNHTAAIHPDDSPGFSGNSVWWTWTSPVSALVTMDTMGSACDTILAIYNGTSLSNLVLVASDDESGGGGASKVTFTAVAGTTYQIAVAGYGGDSGAIVLRVGLLAPPSNDAFANRIVIPGLFSTVTGSNSYATLEPDETKRGTGNTVWWTWTAPSNVTVQLDTAASSFRAVPQVYTGNSISNLTLVGLGNANLDFITFAAVAGTAYQISVDGSDDYAYAGAFSGFISLELSTGPSPPNAAFANRVAFTGRTNSVSGSNVGAGGEIREPYPLISPIWWTWTAPDTGPVMMDTSGSSIAAFVSVFGGDSLSTLSRVAETDRNSGLVTFAASAGTTYQIAIDGVDGLTGNLVLNLRLLPFPANDQFANRLPLVGTNIAFTGWNLFATKELGEPNHGGYPGGRSVWWSWTAPAHGVVVLDSSDSQYYQRPFAVYTGSVVSALSLVASNANGLAPTLNFSCIAGTTYQIAVDVHYGSSVGAYLAFRLRFASPVPNDAFSARIPFGGLSNTVVGYNYGASKETGEPNHAGNPGGRSVWWSWTAPTNWAVTLNTVGSFSGTLLAAYTGNSVSNLTVVASNIWSSGVDGSQVNFPASAGTTYQIAVDGNGGAVGDIVLNLRAAPPPNNDAFANRLPLTGSSNLVAGSNFNATREANEPMHTPTAMGKSVWWRWTAPASGSVEVDTIGSSFDTALAVYTGSSLSALARIASDSDSGGNGASRLNFTAIAGTIYQIVVDSEPPVYDSDNTGSILLNLRQANLPVRAPVDVTYKANWPGFRSGPAFDVEVVDNLAFVSLAGSGLLVVDVANPASLRQVGDLGVLGAGRLATAGRYVYLGVRGFGDGPDGIRVIDVSDPSRPALAGGWDGLPLEQIAVSGNHAYALHSSALVVFDLTDPRQPVPVATNTFSYAQVMAAHKNRVFLGGLGRFWIINVENPANPFSEGTLVLSEIPGGPEQSDLCVDDSYAYWCRDGRLEVIDIRHPEAPKLAGRLRDASSGEAEGPGPHAALAGSTLFIGGEHDLSLIDVTVPTAPRVINRYRTRTATTFNPYNEGIEAIFATSNWVYVAAGLDGLQVVDVANAVAPRLTQVYYTSADARQVAVDGNRVYVQNYPVGVQVIDIGVPESPRLLGTYLYPGEPSFRIHGSYAYIYDSRSAPSVVDFSSPSQPILTARLMEAEAAAGTWYDFSFFNEGRLACARTSQDIGSGTTFSRTNVFRVFDLANPAAPVPLWSCPVQRFVPPLSSSFWIQNQLIHDLSAGGLQVFDIGTPGVPNRIGFAAVPLMQQPVQIRLDEGLVFATGTELTMYDLSNPGRPQPLGSVSPNYTTGVAARKKLVVATGTEGLDVFNVSVPWSPARVGHYEGNSFGSVALAGNLAIVAQGAEGVTILDLGSAFASPPEVTLQPQPRRVLPGADVRFEIGVKGSVPISYQWRLDDIPIPEATNVFLVVTNVRLDQAGRYSVALRNPIGSTNSNDARLEVDQPPTVALLDPENGYLFRSPASISLTADAADTDGFITSVEFFQGSSLVETVTTPPFRATVSNLPVGSYVFTVRARDNEGAATVSAPVRITVTNAPIFQLSRPNYLVNESNGTVTVTVRRNTTGVAGVTYFTANGTARAVVSGGIGSYYGVSNRLNFAAGEMSKDIPILLANDLVNRGNRDFLFQLAAPTAGWFLASPSNAVVTILDDDSPTNNILTDVVSPGPAPGRGSLQVTLTPAVAQGRWRLWWEDAWRESGSTLSNLAAGEHRVQFMPRQGYRPPGEWTLTITQGTHRAVTTNYAFDGIINPPRGALTFTLLPGPVATATNPAARGQWRLPGYSDNNWRNSGEALSNIPAGAHWVEFKAIPGEYLPPSPQLVLVAAGTLVTYEAGYRSPQQLPANGPRALDSFRMLTNEFVPGTPYQFGGQLLSDAGAGSGFAVRPRTVLTAAHVVFDSARLTYSSNLWWFFQRHAGDYEPVPLEPRGSYLFEGYAARRAADRSAGLEPSVSSFESRLLDVAALYFFTNAARGGYSGHLTTTESADWLGVSGLKMLIGYPMEAVAETNRGRMHEAGPVFAALDRISPEDPVYRTDQLLTYPGNSGGPVCVFSTDSRGRPYFIPAGVYLGGDGETVVRAIDLDVVDLINRAERSGGGGGNSTGGGVVPVQLLIGSSLRKHGYLLINVGPPAAWGLGGNWRISPTNSGEMGELAYYTEYRPYRNPYLLSVLSTNFAIQARELPGFSVGLPGAIVFAEGTTQRVDLIYQVNRPRLVFRPPNALGLTGTVGTTYHIERSPSLPGVWSSLETITLGTGTNWVPGTAPTPGASNRFYRARWLSE